MTCDKKNSFEKEWSSLKIRLARSAFRSRFRLGQEEVSYLSRQGYGTIRHHAEDFIKKRLAPAEPKNDGKQTPMRGHPVFVAQHATATCCRECLRKWHGIRKGVELSSRKFEYVIEIIMFWIEEQGREEGQDSFWRS
jgi:hypothetical protein